MHRASTFCMPRRADFILKYRIARSALILGTVAVAACGGPHTSSSALPANQVRVPQSGPSPTPTPYAFKFQTIDDPKSGTYTRAGGIDDLELVVGSVQTSSSGDTSAFTSEHPYTKFFSIPYPSAKSTFATGVNPGGRIVVGYFLSPKDLETRGFLRVKGDYTEFVSPGTPKGPKSVNELLGVNDNQIAVGFYADRRGNDHAYEVAESVFVDIKPPHAVSATANAISLSGTVAGSERLKNGTTEGWMLRSGSFSQFAYPKSATTLVNGLSDAFSDNRVVGSYIDKNGTHGFILTAPGDPSREIWQSVDEPKANGITVIMGMNNHHDISGWYVDSAGKTHGFVGLAKGR